MAAVVNKFIVEIKSVVNKFIVEIKTAGEYFMTSMKGQFFWRIMDEHYRQS